MTEIPAAHEADRAFWRWQYRTGIDEQDNPRAAFLAGFQAGGRAAIRNSSRVIALAPLLREIIAWIEAEEPEAEQELPP